MRIGFAGLALLLVSVSCSETAPSPIPTHITNSSTPTVTARSVSTSTPVVKHDPLATANALLKSSSEPISTPRSIVGSTPRPTPTPSPLVTSTPVPQSLTPTTPIPRPTPTAKPFLNLPSFSVPKTCEALAPEIIALSVDEPPRIVDIRSIRKVSNTKYDLECEARVRFSGRDSYETVLFYREDTKSNPLYNEYYVGFEPILPLTCEQLAPEIFDLSAGAELIILDMSNIKRIQPTGHTLECTADVRWHNPDLAQMFNADNVIRYYMDLRQNGEYIYYYEPKEIKTMEDLQRELDDELKKLEEEIQATMEADIKRLLGEKSAESSSTPTPTSLREIMTDYRGNEARADIKYSEPFTLTATVIQIESDGLMLDAGSFNNYVKAHVSDRNSLAVIDTGDEVKLICREASGSSDNVGVIINLGNCLVQK